MLSHLRISTKLLLLTLMICTAFLLIVCVTVFSFANVRNMLTEVANRDMSSVIDNSRTARELSKIFTDIALLRRTFYGKNDYLESEGRRLVGIVKTITQTTTQPDLNKSLLALSDDLDSFLSQCAAVNAAIYARESIESETYAVLTRLENMISELLVNLTLEGEDTSFVEQLLTLVIGYRESLLQIGKLYAELGHEHYFIPLEGKTSPVTAAIDDLILRFQTITASIPDVALYGESLVSNVQRYREAVFRFYEVMEGLGSRMTDLNHSRILVMSEMESIDKKISRTTQLVSKSIEKVIFSSGAAVVMLSISVIVLLGFATTYLMRSNINNPMKAILKGIESFRKGNFDTQIELDRKDEWETIEKALNGMAADLLRSYSALRESEERFRELAELLPQPVFELDREGSFTYSNRCGLQTFGYTQDDLDKGVNAVQLYIPEERERVKQNIRKRLAGEEFKDHEYTGLKKDGSTFPMLVYSIPIIQAHDQLELEVAERTAELKTANEKLSGEIEERERAAEALQQHVKEMTGLNNLARQVSSSLAVDQVVQAALEGVVAGIGPDLALLFLREGDKMFLQGLRSVETRLSYENVKVHRVGECLCGLACSEGKTVYSPDIHTDPRCTLEECKEAGLVSFAALPLNSGNKITGVLAIASTTEQNFEVKATFLESLTAQVSSGLQNASLYEEVQRYSEQLEMNVAGLKALRLSKLRYQTLFESAPVGIWHAAPDGSGDIVNEGLLKIAGMTQETVRGEGWASGLHPEDKERVYREWSAFVQGKGPYESTYRFRHPDGAVRHVLGQAVPEIGLEGEILGFIGTLTDITEQKHLETKLQEAQKMEAVGTLAGGIAHDFNNLLQAILGYADLLRLRKGKDEPRSRELQEIISASKRGAELTQQLLTFSRRVESKLRPTDLNLGIENTRKIFARTLPKMIEIDLLLSDNLSFVNADPGQMEQILMNLAVNAKDAMPDGGKLTIKTGNVILDEEYCRTHPEAIPGEYVLLEVSDTGHGMAEETLKHIFDPFFTTKGLAEGTGLGLAMVYGIVKSHNGYITCTSDFGTGTTFKIYLPAVEQEEKPEMVVEKDLCRGGTETILLVDDEGFVRDVARQILTEFGYTVIVANDGESALQLYEQERGRVDLVILDLIMPGIGGRKCLEKLLKINPKAKIVVASGFSTIEPIKETVEAGAKGFIGKPYEMKGFLKVVREVLDKP
jgi:PAS domain S-box-containing protein